MSLDFSIENKCEHCGNRDGNSFNITHNLGKMAKAAGIYECLWRPEENGFDTAEQVTPILQKGLDDLKNFPDTFSSFDSDNGWGTYKDFVPWVERVLDCCKRNPKSKIRSCR